MARVTRTDTWRCHTSPERLCKELGVFSIDHNIARRQLGRLGHVSRMDFERLYPAALRHHGCITSALPRRGGPNTTYGRAVQQALDMLNIDTAWQPVVTDRTAWHQAPKHGNSNGTPEKTRGSPGENP